MEWKKVLFSNEKKFNFDCFASFYYHDLEKDEFCKEVNLSADNLERHHIVL